MSRIGDVIEARYRLDAELGAGASGAVFRARDLKSERDVAIKVVRALRPRDRARFAREIQAVARLRDPHTVKMFAHGEIDDDTLYIVFELVAGQNLDQLCKARGPLAPELVVHIAKQVLAALHEAHLAGVVHRDVKPENIRVFPYGGDEHRVKLLDFGIARRPATDDRVTQTGHLIGTPRYMAPEQLLSEPFSAASDIYSLGVVMLEMLLGRDAIHGSALFEQLDRLQSGHLFAVPESQSLPRLASVIARMTAREPQDRFASCDAVLAALGHADETAEVLRPASRPRLPTPAQTRRPRGIVVALVAAFAGVGVGLVLLGLEDSKPTAAPRPAKRARPVVEPTPIATPERAADGCVRDSEAKPGLEWVSSMIGLDEHLWLRQVPAHYEAGRRHPVIVLLAREEMDEQQFLDESGFRALADEVGAIVLAPKPKTTALDLTKRSGLIETIVKRTRDELCIDDARVFVVGHGSGGHGARRLSCEPWVAAAVTASARPERGTSCERAAPYLLMSPTRSPREPLHGGTMEECRVKQHLLSLDEHERVFLQRNGCDGEPTVRERVGRSVCREWSCGGAPFMHCRLDGGSSWPGQAPRTKCDGEATDFPAAQVVWSFFERAVVTDPRP